jgi:hypothetical protein
MGIKNPGSGPDDEMEVEPMTKDLVRLEHIRLLLGPGNDSREIPTRDWGNPGEGVLRIVRQSNGYYVGIVSIDAKMRQDITISNEGKVLENKSVDTSSHHYANLGISFPMELSSMFVDEMLKTLADAMVRDDGTNN